MIFDLPLSLLPIHIYRYIFGCASPTSWGKVTFIQIHDNFRIAISASGQERTSYCFSYHYHQTGIHRNKQLVSKTQPDTTITNTATVGFTLSGTQFAERSLSTTKLPLVFLCRPRQHRKEKKLHRQASFYQRY